MSIERRDWMMMAGVAVLAAVFVGLVWLPQRRHIGRLEQDIEAAKKELGIARDQADGLVQLALEVRRLQRQVASNQKVIPPADEMASVLHELSVFIEDQDLTGQGLSTEPTVRHDDFLVMPVEMQFMGDSLAAYDFVHRLESMPRLVQVEHLSMKAVDATSGQVLTTLKLNTYFTAQEDRLP